MRVLVVGASRGTGAELVSELAQRGHVVTAFARSADGDVDGVSYVAGDVLDADAVTKAVAGQDAVVVTLGIPDNPFRVRLTRRASSRLDVRSAGTANVVRAMTETGVRRLLVQSTYGIGDTYRRMPLALKAFFSLAIRPQVTDHEVQEATVRASDLDWTIIRPVVLHDEERPVPATVRTDDTVPAWKVSRRQVARAMADALSREEWVGRTLSVSE
ncbi:NAD(P)-binding oxidoreductase [Nocardioides sp.]|uniref:NAD(P)-dependent oxidoreductase n=1 Tax=Nocardioides sp. TaxID=35761 RepID=UPI001A34D17B|nr:NAD(P)-binding oxidoreductase [Nocardioides sp.]MBJ7355998.1 SDR family oxidoreductase [Nocardioides sp.]